MKRFDLILVVGIVLIAGVFFGVNQHKAKMVKENSDRLVVAVSVDGELYKTIDLKDHEEEIVIETELGKNVVKVHDDGVEMVEADCSDHICEQTGFVKEPGNMIVCLPNKVVVEIKGEANEIDGLSN